jgi:hypothetical protein
MDLILSIILGVIGSLIAAEVWANSPRIAHWLIDRAVRRLPDRAQERYREEWKAHANELPGSIAKLCHASSCWFRAYAVARALAEPKPLEPYQLRRIKRVISLCGKVFILIRSLPDVVCGRFDKTKIYFAIIDHFTEVFIDHKLRRNITDVQMQNVFGTMMSNFKANMQDPVAFSTTCRKIINKINPRDKKAQLDLIISSMFEPLEKTDE